MIQNKPELKKLCFSLAFILGVLGFLYITVFQHSGQTKVWLRVSSESKGHFKIFWAASGQKFDEERSETFGVSSRPKTLKLVLPSWRKVKRLRVDPANESNTSVTIHSIGLREAGFVYQKLLSADDFSVIKPVKDIDRISYTDQGIEISTKGNDAQLLWVNNAFNPIYLYYFMALIFIAVCLLYANQVYRLLYSYPGYCLMMVIVFATLIVFSTPYHHVFQKGPFYYLVKAIEISKGDFRPVEFHFIGWPIALGAILYLLQIDTILEGMVVARAASTFLITAAIIPFAGICKKLLKPKAAFLAVTGFTVSSYLHYAGRSGKAEACFVFFVLISIFFLVRIDERKQNWLWAIVFASLSYYVRPHGLFLLATILICFLVSRPYNIGKLPKAFLLIVLFFAVSFPHLYSRHVTYGSPFEYGSNSKYFVSERDAIFDADTEKQSMLGYIQNHTPQQIYTKFVKRGFNRILKWLNRMAGDIWIVSFYIGLGLYFFIGFHKGFLGPILFFIINVLGMSLIWEAFGTPRYLLILMPFIFLIASQLLVDLADLIKPRLIGNALLVIFASFIIYTAPWPDDWEHGRFQIPKVRESWAVWAAENVEGNIAIRHGTSYIRMNLPIKEMDKIQPFRLRKHANLDGVFETLKRRKADYLFISPKEFRVSPYLNEIYSDHWANHFHLVYSTKSGYLTRGMSIFKVKY